MPAGQTCTLCHEGEKARDLRGHNESARRAQSPVRFEVRGDGKTLWVSGPMQERGLNQRCEVSVRGIDELELRVHCPGKNSYCQGVWLDPVVTK